MPGYCLGHPDDLSSSTIHIIDAIADYTMWLLVTIALEND